MRHLSANKVHLTVDNLEKISKILAVIDIRSQRSIVTTVGMHEGAGGTSKFDTSIRLET